MCCKAAIAKGTFKTSASEGLAFVWAGSLCVCWVEDLYSTPRHTAQLPLPDKMARNWRCPDLRRFSSILSNTNIIVPLLLSLLIALVKKIEILAGFPLWFFAKVRLLALYLIRPKNRLNNVYCIPILFILITVFTVLKSSINGTMFLEKMVDIHTFLHFLFFYFSGIKIMSDWN